MRRCMALLLAMAMVGLAMGQSEEKVQLHIVTYDELCTAIDRLKGQVVVVDVWANWCHPCKAAFPHLVDLHEKYAKKGLIAVSISLDFPSDKAEVVKFLQNHRAHFA